MSIIFLNSWRVYHFHDTGESAPVKKSGKINDNLFLREDAGNLSAFLYRMKAENPKHYLRIVSVIQLVIRNFKDFLLRPDPSIQRRTDKKLPRYFDNNDTYTEGVAKEDSFMFSGVEELVPYMDYDGVNENWEIDERSSGYETSIG